MNRDMVQPQYDSYDLPPSTVLRRRYQIISTLGRGGFGITYIARDLKNGCSVAVKELFPQAYVLRMADHCTVRVVSGRDASFSHMFKSFENEAKTLIQLQKQEGIVRLFHLFNENGTAYYVMELLRGEDLNRRLMRCGFMSWSQFAPILQTLLSALEQIHGEGLIHRDISPDNIFLTESGDVRLIDFGSVRTYQSGDYLTAIIKHGFAPWEQYLTDGAQGPWTDIYALSVTTYYVLSGKMPPDATQRRLQDTITPLSALCPSLPTTVCKAIHKGMAVRIEDRFQNIRLLRDALFPEDLENSSSTGSLFCQMGVFSGHSWQLQPGTMLHIGRSPECELVFPSNAPGISRHQCTVYHGLDGKTLVRDDNSSFGTFLLSGSMRLKMEPGKWYPTANARICFGQQEEYIIK